MSKRSPIGRSRALYTVFPHVRGGCPISSGLDRRPIRSFRVRVGVSPVLQVWVDPKQVFPHARGSVEMSSDRKPEFQGLSARAWGCRTARACQGVDSKRGLSARAWECPLIGSTPVFPRARGGVGDFASQACLLDGLPAHAWWCPQLPPTLSGRSRFSRARVGVSDIHPAPLQSYQVFPHARGSVRKGGSFDERGRGLPARAWECRASPMIK